MVGGSIPSGAITNMDNNAWTWIFFLASMAAVPPIIWKTLKKFPAPVKLLVIWCLWSGLLTFMSPVVPFPEVQTIMAIASIRGVVVLLMCLFLQQKFWNNWWDANWKKIILYAGCLELFLCTLGPHIHAGLMRASTMSSCFFAATIALVPQWAWFLWVAAILYLGGATAKIILAAQLLAYLFCIKRLRWYVASFSAVLVAAGTYALSQFQGESWLSRLQHWELFGRFYLENPRIWVQGVGIGTQEWMGYLVQRFSHHLWYAPLPWIVDGHPRSPLSATSAQEFFREMHNDWFQIGFELGAVGLSLALITGAALLAYAYKYSKKNFIVLCGFAAWMCFYHPLHAPLSIFLFVCLLKRGSCEIRS